MKVSEAFPSAFLKADDLGGKAVTVTIDTVTLEELGQGSDREQKLIVGFVGKSKKLVCNKTNAKTIAKLYGDDTDNWPGKRITLVAREVEFSGETVWAIRVSLTAPAPAGAKVAAPAPKPVEPPDEPVDDPALGDPPPF